MNARSWAFATALICGCGTAPAEDPKEVNLGSPELVRTGFQFTEGPAYDDAGGLYFSDIPAQRIYYLSKDGKLSVFREPTGSNNGLFLRGGYLYGCEHLGVVRYKPGDAKSREVLAEEFNGARFNAPNDLVVDAEGGIYFTDPEYGAPMPWPQGVRGVYYIAPGGKVTRVVEDLPNPNGVILSPDEKTLYVAPSSQAEVMAYEVLAPGKLGPGRVFATLAQPEGQKKSGSDGVTIDRRGNLYCTTGLGVEVFAPSGKSVALVRLPEVPANVTFGGADRRTLYATARTSVYRIATNQVGQIFESSAPAEENR